MKYQYLGAQVETLESGAPLVFGDTTEEADPRLIEANLLVPVDDEVATPTASVTSPNEKETGADASGT